MVNCPINDLGLPTSIIQALLSVQFYILFVLHFPHPFVFVVVRLNFTQTWGDHYYLGLTGIELLGENFEPLPIELSWMDVSSCFTKFDFMASKSSS